MKQLIAYCLLLIASLAISYKLLAISVHATSEEEALYSINQGLRPKEVNIEIQTTPQEEKKFLDSLKKFFDSWLSNTTALFKSILIDKPEKPQQFAENSDIFAKSVLPKEVIPKLAIDEKYFDKVKEDLGTKKGVYSVQANLPDEIIKDNSKITDFECDYEKAFYPKGVKPITEGAGCN